MENLRNPMVSRAAALEAAERLQQLAILLEDDGVLKKIVSEAHRTICLSTCFANRHVEADALAHPFGVGSGQTRSRRLLS